MKKKVFELKDLHVDFPVQDGAWGRANSSVHAVNGVNLEVYKNEIISLVGESGCGKSTMAMTILGLNKKTQGAIFFNGKNVDDFSKNEWKEFHKKCQLVFQNPFSSLNPRMTIFDILKEPLVVNGIKSKQEINDRILHVLDLVGLDKWVVSRYPHEFSGGQRQRIAIARALILEPDVIIADEPVSALDVSIQAQIINLLLDLKNKLNLTIIFISHDLSVVKHISDRVAVMYMGEIVEIADKKSLFDNPIHPYTKALLAAIPKINGQKNQQKPLEGDLPSVKDLPNGCFFQSRCNLAKKVCQNLHPDYKLYTPEHKVACHFIIE